MTYSRPVRILLGFLVLAVLGWYIGTRFVYGVTSNVLEQRQNMPAATAAVSEPQQDVIPENVTPVPTPAETPVPTPEPTPEPTPRPEELKAAELGLPAPPEVDINSWELMLVNAKHPIDTYEPETIAYLSMNGEDTNISYDYSDYRCPVDARIAQALVDFTQGCKQAGLPVYLSSGYRSYDTQNYLFQRKIGQGYSADVAATIVARPGTSEHQTGLVCDITDYYHELKDSSLEQTATYQWLKEHCAEYGFVVRYPADKSGSADSVTGIIYEPWHFRYVGKEAATYMMQNNLCLEEFLALYGVE